METKTELLRPQEAAKFLGISRSQLYNVIEREDNFPEKVVLGEGTRGFLRRDLVNYLEQKKVGKNGGGSNE